MPAPMTASMLDRSKAFKNDENGTVAIIFGLTAIVATMFVGMAIDTGRVMHARSNIVAAADAAALSAAKALRIEGKTEAQAIAIGTTVFNLNMTQAAGRWAMIDSVAITVDPTTGEVVANIASHVNLAFANVLGFQRTNIPVRAAALFDAKDIEVAVQLDLTGSMCEPFSAPCTDRPKIQGLKDATKDLVDILIPSTPGPQRVRIAYAPFTAGVNVGSFQPAVANGQSSTDKCVYERYALTNQHTDVTPVANDSYKTKADLQAAGVGSPKACPNAPVVPLIGDLAGDKQLLKDTVDAYVADGNTAGHNGTAWAFNLLSPNWSGIWPTASQPAAYNPATTAKSVILMTDGVYNTFGGQSGQAVASSDKAVETCTAMKAAGIRVYTVGFALNDISNATDKQRAIDTLAACASGTADFFQAATPADLRIAFRNIANNIMKLRLSS